MIDRRELDRIAKAARLRTAKRPETATHAVRVHRDCPCASCGYNLKGLSFNTVCPECAAPVQRSISPEDPDAKPWIDASRWRPQWWIDTFGPPAPLAPTPNEKPGEHVKPVVPQPQVCGVCNYDCKGLPRGAPCPECGTPRTLSGSASSVASQESLHGLSSHGWDGAAIGVGWAMAGLGLIAVWLAFFINAQSTPTTPLLMIAFVGYALGAVGGASAAWGVWRLMLAAPPPPVSNDISLPVRIVAFVACAAWAAANAMGVDDARGAITAVGALGVGSRLHPAPLFWLGLAGLPLAVYCHAMVTVGGLVAKGERTFRSGVLGFPAAVLITFFLAWMSQQATGTFFEISILAGAGTIVCGLFPVYFVSANMRVGLAIWWAPLNRQQVMTREERKRAAWEARAQADRARERRFGNSARH